MRPRVYIETSVLSYLTALPSRDLVRAAHQQITAEWWTSRETFELFNLRGCCRRSQQGRPVSERAQACGRRGSSGPLRHRRSTVVGRSTAQGSSVAEESGDRRCTRGHRGGSGDACPAHLELYPHRECVDAPSH